MRDSAVAARDVAGGLLGLRSTGHSIGTSVLGGLLGGLAGAATGVLVTDLIKRILAVVSSQDSGSSLSCRSSASRSPC